VTNRCPNGHTSGATDYCDECGAPIEAARAEEGTRVTSVARCSHCHAILQPGDRFCEGCGHDVSVRASVSPWTATVTADRAYHEQLSPDGIDFPVDASPSRTVALESAEVPIGRDEPDLSTRPPDPAVSRRHACLRRRDDGTYVVVDLGSANGTWLDDAKTPLTVGVEIAVVPGTRIHVGAWTTITVDLVGRDPEPPPE
jgi:FHA domain/Double zinc ribbon